MNARQVLRAAKRLVVKVGTTQITENGLLSKARMEALADAIREIRARRIEVVLVSSGAISAGVGIMGLQSKKGLSIPYRQAAAAIGQTQLMQLYAEAFARHTIPVGQVLLTRDVLRHRERYLNAANTLAALLKLGALPIINENDTMVVDEIKVGDNDRLAAMAAELVNADLLVLLSDVDGFYENWENTAKRRLVSHIQRVDENLEREAKAEGSKHATGGMRTKLDAAKMCAKHGVQMVLASGEDPRILLSILAGEEVGSFFEAQDAARGQRGRKYWIAQHLVARGTALVDEGAALAIREHGKSLLPGGITEIRGDFAAGDGLDIAGQNGVPFARGITNYGREDLSQIAGHQSREIRAILGYIGYDEVVHRDNMVMLD
ncbi:MAG: glutamate 5-kinase [Spirochaetota bacterium]|jgi:glutamate 5-kinase|nr:glutamate 5-kinase [Spirochaetota bacterium]